MRRKEEAETGSKREVRRRESKEGRGGESNEPVVGRLVRDAKKGMVSGSRRKIGNVSGV